MRTPLHFLWKRLKALLQKRAVRVRHCAVTLGFHWSLEDWEEDEEAFLFLILAEELFG